MGIPTGSFQLSTLQWCVDFVDGGNIHHYSQANTHTDIFTAPNRQLFNVNDNPGQGFVGKADADDVVVIVTPRYQGSQHIAAPVGMVMDKDTDGFGFKARNSDCNEAGGDCGFNYFAYSRYLGDNPPPEGLQPTPAPSARLLTVQPAMYYPNCQPGDTNDTLLKFWKTLPSDADFFLTACDSGVTGCDFPALFGHPGTVPAHHAAVVGIVDNATQANTQFTLHSRNSDTAAGMCAFYAFAITQPIGQTGDAGSLIIDSGTIKVGTTPGWPEAFEPSGQYGDSLDLPVYFNQPYSTPPVVLLTANNEGAAGAQLAFVVGMALNVTPNGFMLHARNSDSITGACGFYWVAIGCSQGCG